MEAAYRVVSRSHRACPKVLLTPSFPEQDTALYSPEGDRHERHVVQKQTQGPTNNK